MEPGVAAVPAGISDGPRSILESDVLQLVISEWVQAASLPTVARVSRECRRLVAGSSVAWKLRIFQPFCAFRPPHDEGENKIDRGAMSLEERFISCVLVATSNEDAGQVDCRPPVRYISLRSWAHTYGSEIPMVPGEDDDEEASSGDLVRGQLSAIWRMLLNSDRLADAAVWRQRYYEHCSILDALAKESPPGCKFQKYLRFVCVWVSARAWRRAYPMDCGPSLTATCCSL